MSFIPPRVHSNPHPSRGPCSGLGLAHCRTKLAPALLTRDRGEMGHCKEGIRLLTSPNLAEDSGDPEPLGQEGVWGGETTCSKAQGTKRWCQLAARDLPGRARLQSGPQPARAAVRGHWDTAATSSSSAMMAQVLRCLEGVARAGKTRSRLQFSLAAQHTVGIRSCTHGDFSTQNRARVLVLRPHQ